MEYVENRTLRGDLGILLATVGKVLRRDGIAAEDSVTMPEFMGTPTVSSLSTAAVGDVESSARSSAPIVVPEVVPGAGRRAGQRSPGRALPGTWRGVCGPSSSPSTSS